MTEVTRPLAAFVANSRYGALPENVRRQGAQAFVNWVGCAFNGCGDPAVEIATRVLGKIAGSGNVTLVGRREHFDAATVAYLNCLSWMVDSYNDTHLASICHPAGAVIAAALAVAEENGASGEDFVHAVILGIEVTCRVSNILSAPPGNCHVGINMSGYTGGIGAAAAVAKLLELNERQITHAFSIAATHAAGFRQGQATMAGMASSPHAARTGLVAALLAADGFTSSDQTIEGKKGLGDTLGTPPNFAAAVDGLGDRFEILTDMPKPYPCGIVVHPAIDACLELTRTDGFAVDRIDRVALTVPSLSLELAGKTEPKSAGDAVNSLFHWAAISLLRGRAGLAESRDEAVLDRDVVALRRRIVAVADPALADDAARAELFTTTGQTYRVAVEHCRGSAQNPMSDADLDRKFLELAAPHVPKSDAGDLLQACWRVDEIADVGAFARARLRASESTTAKSAAAMRPVLQR